MAIIDCPECGKKISDRAVACPDCGNPMNRGSAPTQQAGTHCPSCKITVTPVVTSVGGGSCSVGKRETWKCPRCKRILHKSGCFVATVTYGDEDVVEVRFLRAFRDQVLSKTVIGRVFIFTYYKFSPYIARALEISPAFRNMSRRWLDWVVEQIERRTHLKRGKFRESLP